MVQIADKPFTQLLNLNILDELRFKGKLFGEREFDSQVPVGDITAVSGDWIEANNRITVTLDNESEVDDEIIVTNGDGTEITIYSTISIKFTETTNVIITRTMGTTLHFQMFGNGDEKYWRIR